MSLYNLVIFQYLCNDHLVFAGDLIISVIKHELECEGAGFNHGIRQCEIDLYYEPFQDSGEKKL